MHPKEHGYPVRTTPRSGTLAGSFVQVQRQVKRGLMIAIHAAADSTYNTCEAVIDVLADFPDLLFFMVHSGYILGREDASPAPSAPSTTCSST